MFSNTSSVQRLQRVDGHDQEAHFALAGQFRHCGCMNVTPLFAKASNLVFRQQLGSVMPNSTQRPMDQDYVIGKDEFLRAFEEIHSR